MQHFYSLYRAFFVVTAKKTLLMFSFLLTIKILTAQPVIHSISPDIGPVGTTVTISGNNFSPVLANNIVRFGAVKAVVTAANATSLSVVVPSGASYGPISVTANNLTTVSSALYRISFPGNISQFSDETFIKEPGILTGSYNTAPILMDMDDDGKPDMIAIDNINGGICIVKNAGINGSVAFLSRVNIIPGVQPGTLRACDIDNDGKIDILYPVPGQQAFAIHRNQSTQSGFAFGSAETFTTPGVIGSFSVGDVNLDGKPDIVTGYPYPSTQLSVYRNTGSVGNLSFDQAVTFEITENTVTTAIQDLDGDNLPEIAIATYGSTALGILRNTSTNGGISFGPVSKFPANIFNFSMACADMDGDGKMDIVLGHSAINKVISVFRNTSSTGNISFDPKKDFPISYHTFSLSVNDFDGDGKPDILVSNLFEAYTLLLRNRSASGAIAFSEPVNYATTTAVRDIIAGDITGEGKPEFLVLTAEQRAEVFRNRLMEPILTTFSPASGHKNSVITISGKNFTGITNVRFGGTPAASFTVINPTTIEAVVAEGASGDISVTSSAGTGKIPNFLFIPAPSIRSISDTIGTKGSEIIIDGKNFNNATNILFGGTPVNSFTVVSDTRINAILGPGASGSVEVITPAGKGSLAGFTYIGETVPYIVSFTPEIATQGQTVTINGLNFTGATAVSFGGISVNTFTVVSAGKIVATVAAGSSGEIKVTTATGTATISGFTYGTAPVPSISSFSPMSAKAGEQVIIHGSNFSNIPSNNFVVFGAVKGKVIAASSTSLTVTVPSGATYDPIVVTTNGYSTQSSLPFTLTFEGAGIALATQDFKSSFGASIAYEPEDVQTHDLDGDQKPDIGVLNDGMYVDLYRNTSNEQGLSFAGRIRFQAASAGSIPDDLKIADLNNDGKSDLIIAIAAAGQVVTMKNKSTPGAFSFDYPVPVTYYYTGRSFRRISVNDIDLDGKADIVATDNHPSTITIYRNTSSADVIQFADGMNMNVGRYVLTTLLRDIDGDNKPDLILTSNETNTVSILRNTSSPGNIQFAPPVTLSGQYNTLSIFVADYNGDGKPDLSSNFSFFINTSTPGTISFETRFDLPGADSYYLIGTGDLDGDGKIDLTYRNGMTIGTMKNVGTTGNISFSLGGVYSVQASAFTAINCDYDGDGKPDLAVANRNASYSELILFRNNIGEALVVPSGTNPVTGNILQKIFFDPVVQTHNGKPFVQRHYDINPVNNTHTATATVTLFFTQPEFDNYNAHPAHVMPLPTNPNDQLGKANLRIYQYHGFSASGLPGSYAGEAVELNPEDEKIVWNATLQRWEVTFNITGFSGFFAGSAGASLLPVRLLSFSGKARNDDIVLQWNTGYENNVSRFEIKRSSNGIDFKTIGAVTAANLSVGASYSFIDPNPLTGNNFYRLSTIDLDETREESKILLISFNNGAHVITSLAPNPTKANVTLKLEGRIHGMVLLALYDYTGKLMFTKTMSAANGTQSTVEIPTGNCPKGAYILQVKANGQVTTHKIVVQ